MKTLQILKVYNRVAVERKSKEMVEFISQNVDWSKASPAAVVAVAKHP